MFGNIEINKSVHKQDPFFIIAFLRKVDLIIIEISKKSFETAINFINDWTKYSLFFIKYFINNLISTSEDSGKVWRQVTLFSSNKVLNLIMWTVNNQHIFTKTTLLDNFADKHFTHCCYNKFLRNETGKYVATTLLWIKRYL